MVGETMSVEEMRVEYLKKRYEELGDAIFNAEEEMRQIEKELEVKQ